MDSINSFKGYGKVKEAEEQAFRKKTRRRLTIIVVSVIILVMIIVGAAVGSVIHKKNSSSDGSKPSTSAPVDSLKAVCSVTQYPDSCLTSIASIESSSDKADPEELFKLSLKVAIDELSKISTLPDRLAAGTTDQRLKLALADCKTMFEDAIDELNTSLSSMLPGKGEKLLSDAKLADIRTWISTAATDQDTCLDGLAEFSQELRIQMEKEIRNSTQFTSNSLAIATKIMTILEKLNVPIHRKLLSVGFPGWVSSKDRKLLQEAKPTPDVTVAKDGTGQFKTIAEAVASVPKKNEKRYVIYVKEGVYVENVIIDKSKWNVMMYGDGQDKTIVSGSKNVVDGTPTFSTATVAAVGRNFIAKDMSFKNTAGPKKHQAVALRAGSDRSVFFQCSFDAFQDTLYAHSNRQFYRNCDITGTIDFIFGNAAAIFQDCTIRPRQPDTNQLNTITAQGKNDPNQNTGISIQQCQITAFDNLTAPTYLGRPWRPYSTTIIMQSGISNIVHPAGWLSWISNTVPPKTIFYAEYENTGPGSNVANRVTWPGYNPAVTENQALRFTVNSFIQGSEWLPETGVLYGASL
ncbi:pectinesterase 3-like [Magnolia sinica]|uniref:pectinesterase 3-like n=1 Tax=Magnolia sinica TaxID=86752 RepID=UPI00265A9A29|nr:pectinesterase 3-like [Magnolia sinica]